MKIVIGYPPFDEAGNYQIGQNRQAQRFEHGAFIFPVIPAYAATMLKNAGHEVYWLDGPAEGMDWERYLKELEFIQPDLIAWEVKTPTVKRVWPLIDQIKGLLGGTKVVLMGDHVSALPDESLTNCEVDYVIKGGDYDFSLLHTLSGFETSLGRPVEFGKASRIIDVGTHSSLDRLPVIDRELCKWRLYGFENGSGNYKYLPGTHTMFGRDCWWRHQGGCTFCSWTNKNFFPNWRVTSTDKAMEEIEACARLGIREVFDDTGTFPIGKWLHEFCEKLRKFNKGLRHGRAKITMGANMRPGALQEEDWKLMGASGFRFILFGLESASQATIEKINKGQKDGDIEESCRLATKHGMHPHATCMVGYPWETREEAEKTIELTRSLFRKGWIQTLQATIVIPYPGTELYKQCQENGWLKTTDYNDFDMRRPVMKCPMTDEEVLAMTRGIYKSCITPQFVLKKLFSARTKDDLAFLAKGARYMLGHLKDFGGNYGSRILQK